MLVKQFVDEKLGNSSYLVASKVTGEAVLIDPQRDVERYVQIAEGLGLKLTHALETHLHADFVSGLRELAEQYQIGHRTVCGRQRILVVGCWRDAARVWHCTRLSHPARGGIGCGTSDLARECSRRLSPLARLGLCRWRAASGRSRIHWVFPLRLRRLAR